MAGYRMISHENMQAQKNSNMTLHNILTCVKRNIVAASSTVDNFCLPEEFSALCEEKQNKIVRNVFSDFKADILAKCSLTEEFALAPDIEFSALCKEKERKNLQNVFSHFKVDILDKCSMSKEFTLPEDMKTQKISGTETLLVDSKVASKSQPCQHPVIDLIPNMHLDCSNSIELPGGVSVCGCEINIPILNVNEQNVEGNSDKTVSTKKRVRRKTLSSRSHRQRDKERKRIERHLKAKEKSITNIGNTDNKWKQMYKQKTSYRDRKKSLAREKYHTDTSYSQKKKTLQTLKYKECSEHKKTLKHLSVKKYKENLQHRQSVIQYNVRKYKENSDYRQYVQHYSRKKYKDNVQHRQSVQQYSRKKYKDNVQHRQSVQQYSRKKYKDNVQHRQSVQQYSRKKYKDNVQHRQSVQQYSRKKYKDNVQHRQSVQQYSRKKYKDNVQHRESVNQYNRKKYKDNLQYRASVKQYSKQKYLENKVFQKMVKQASRLKYSHNSLHRHKLKLLKRLKYRTCALYRLSCKQRKRNEYRQSIDIRRKKIEKATLTRNERKLKSDISMYFQQEVKDGPLYVCCVCFKMKFRKQVVICDEDKYSTKSESAAQMAVKCISHKYKIRCSDDCQEDCEILNHGTLWICHSCHRNILQGKMPVDANANNLNLLPIPDELKHMNSLEKQLLSLRIPFMKLVQLPKGAQKGIVGPCVSVPTDIEKTTQVLPRTDDENQLIRVKLKRKLPYKGHHTYQFVSTKRIKEGLEYLQKHNKWYNQTTLHPSWQNTAVNDHEELVSDDMEQSVAVVEENMNDDESKGTMEDDENLRNRGMPSDTCLQPVDVGQEILDQHFDDIFCVAPGEGNTPVSMLREDGNEAMSFPVQFPDGVTGTYNEQRTVNITRLRYFHSRLLNADNRFSSDTAYIFYAQYLSELEQVISKVSIALRKSTATDSSGKKITASSLTDKSHLKNLLKTDQGYKFLTPIRGTPPYWQATMNDLMAMIRQLGIPTWFCTFSAADMRWNEVLQVLLDQQNNSKLVEDLDWTEKCDLLRKNPIMTATLFDHRFHIFLKQIIINRKVIGKVKDYFYRIEFQQRGSPHAHCLFWIEDAPILDNDEDQLICNFVDKYVTCALPDKQSDEELYDIACSVQQHSKTHSKSCKKKGTVCRFNFPRQPSQKTFVSRPQSLTDPDVQQTPQQLMTKAKTTLSILWELMKNISLETVTTQELFAKAGLTQEEFQEASNILTKRKSIVLQRKPSDSWINQYNSDLLRCWNANMDIQYVTDAYSCVMYIISYISKAEREMGLVLDQAQKEAAEGNLDAQKAMKKISGAYFHQREVSAQEAAYRVCGLHLKESSRKVQFIPTGDNQVKMSLPLKIIQSRSQDMDDDDIWMSSIYDKYKARPQTPEFDCISYAKFSSEYRILSLSQVPKDYVKKEIFQLQNQLGYIKKRTRSEAAVIRYPRFKVKKNPEQYYKSNLQLFLPHRNDSQLKPNNFQTYEEFYTTGAVSFSHSGHPKTVKTVVDQNRQLFEINAEVLDEAQELIENVGPLEDAWAIIGPQSEAERLESAGERQDHEHDHDSVIPELDTHDIHERSSGNLEISPNKQTGKEIKPLLQQLNKKQKMVFYKIRRWCLNKVNGKHPEPFHVFVNGGAGTGKSHLIKCLHYEAKRILSPQAANPDDAVVLLTAPTATAAFNIGGTTLHQAFSLPKSLPLPYHYKRDDELNSLRTKYQSLEILIIDEISMVGQRLLTYVNERLRQIKQTKNAVFGKICVIAVGDFYQLPPVKQKCLYDVRPGNFFPLWSSNFEIVELDQIMRQKDDLQFAKLLNRLRIRQKGNPLELDDISALKVCSQNVVPPETLHIFATNAEVNAHNQKMIDNVCDVTETLTAQDFDKDPCSHKLTLRETPYSTTHDFLPIELKLGVNARVMLTRNIDITMGLVNGALGTVTKILPRKSGSSLPCGVKVRFDHQKAASTDHSSILPVIIEPLEEKLNNNAMRHQFPLQLAWACTTHKVQGMTTDKAVVSFQHIFAAGMAYVALSRVTKKSGLVIQNFDPTKIYCIEQISNALQKMPPFITPPDSLPNKSSTNVMLHNIQGFIPNFDDISANTDIANADFIALTETWMPPHSSAPKFHSYSFTHVSRLLSYSCDSPLLKSLKYQKHGGVGMLCRDNTKYCDISPNTGNIEAMSLLIQDINTILVVVYRPDSYTASIFIDHLHRYLSALPLNADATIVMGDFNQDLFKSSSIKAYMEGQGYKQLVEHCTTDGGTLIDHVYLRGRLNITINIIPAYYSYHDIISLDIQQSQN